MAQGIKTYQSNEVGQECEPVRSGIRGDIDNILGTINMIDERVDQLNCRIDPVLKTATPTPSPGDLNKKELNVSSDLGAELREIRGKLQRIANHIADITDRIDL